jgi:glyceraldehyde 3-phosphate dehydrogenase
MRKPRVAINGFGRIGRTVYKEIVRRNCAEVVVIRDIANVETLWHLLKYDSTQGHWTWGQWTNNAILTENGNAAVVQSNDIPNWKDWNVDVVIECTGTMKSKEELQIHIQKGAKKVILSSPAQDDLLHWIIGVNDAEVNKNDLFFSCASCTTNNVAPIIQTIDKALGIESCYISTVHSYTSDQRLHDAPHKDLRRARSAPNSIVPTTTGAAKALTKVFPHLSHQIGGCGMRVPVANGSLSDITFIVKRNTSVEEVLQMFEEYQSLNPTILWMCNDPIVSRDILGDTHSCILDVELTSVIGKMVKVVGWYDNEMGYSNRLIDAITYLYS